MSSGFEARYARYDALSVRWAGAGLTDRHGARSGVHIRARVGEVTDFAPLRDRLVALRLQTLVALAEQPDDGALDAELLALVADVQTALVAIEEMEN